MEKRNPILSRIFSNVTPKDCNFQVISRTTYEGIKDRWSTKANFRAIAISVKEFWVFAFEAVAGFLLLSNKRKLTKGLFSVTHHLCNVRLFLTGSPIRIVKDDKNRFGYPPPDEWRKKPTFEDICFYTGGMEAFPCFEQKNQLEENPKPKPYELNPLPPPGSHQHICLASPLYWQIFRRTHFVWIIVAPFPIAVTFCQKYIKLSQVSQV